jgi:hypothetical protein
LLQPTAIARQTLQTRELLQPTAIAPQTLQDPELLRATAISPQTLQTRELLQPTAIVPQALGASQPLQPTAIAPQASQPLQRTAISPHALGTSQPVEGVVTVLGDGGATVALRQAAAQRGTPLTVLRWQQALGARVEGSAVWTWPPHLGAPAGLRLEGSRVAVIAYGAAGKAIAELIRACGGVPVRLGARWFIAQARAQRTRWETAR